jgi:hypothetical protein
MGRRYVRVIAVRRWATACLLALTTVAMIGLLYLLSGRAYVAEARGIRDLVGLFGRGEIDRDALLAVLMPFLASFLLFVPWGFLAFVLVDAPGRPRAASYLLTIGGAVILAAAVIAWQSRLPAPVTTWEDAIANAVGAFAGASLGHARKTVRVRFDF